MRMIALLPMETYGIIKKEMQKRNNIIVYVYYRNKNKNMKKIVI